MAEQAMMRKYIAEFIGTFLLTFTVGCNTLATPQITGANWSPTSIACVLMVAIYALAPTSGGHFNPAVSCALGFAGKAGSWAEIFPYCAVQILGAVCAGLCYNVVLAGHGQKPFTLGPQVGFGWTETMLVEVLYTCMLCFVVLNVATTRTSAGKEFYGLAIGFVIVAAGYAAGGISGGAFNPAVSIGIDFAGRATSFGWCLGYSCFQILGALLAAILFRAVRPEEYGQEEYTVHTPKVKALSEFIGTFYLCFTVGLCVLGKSPATAWSAAAALMCMIYSLGSVSGANFNPAVTLAIYLRGLHNLRDVLWYMAAQLLASVVAALLCICAYHKTYGFGPGDAKAGYGWKGVASAEVTFTFVLCFVVLSVCTVQSNTLQHMYGLAIGSCVTAGGLAIGAVSGGALNPAVALGATIVDGTQGGAKLTDGLAFAALECLGGALAAFAFKAVHGDGTDK